MFNIVVVSPNSFFIDALRHNLSGSEFAIAECVTQIAGLSGSLKLAEARCDLVIVDFEAYEAEREIARMKKLRPALRILSVLQTFNSKTTASCFHAGCDGVLLSSLKLENLTQHLTLLMGGHKVFPNQVAELMCEISMQDAAAPVTDFGSTEFSQRQSKILKLVIDGAQNKCIARALKMPLTTVKADIKTMMRKTGAQNRTDLAIGVLRKGWGGGAYQDIALAG